MQVHSHNNQQNFQGIKLSSNNVTDVKKTVNLLKREGYYCLGKKDLFCNNTTNDIIKIIKWVRSRAYFFDKEFGVIFLPWSKSAYIISNRLQEQTLIKEVKKIDPKAKLNLAI